MTKKQHGPLDGCRRAVPKLLSSAFIPLAIGFTPQLGLAQSVASQSDQAASEHRRLVQAEPRDFRIPAQPLTSALTAFGDQADMQVTVDTAILAGRQSRAVSGTMAPEEALGRLLDGSGITWRYTDPTTLVLSNDADDGPIMLGPVTVEGRGEWAYGPVQGYVANRTATGTKTDVAINEVPQSVSVVTRDQIDARGARSIAEALAYTAGVATGQRGESTGLGNANVVIRGFGGTGTINEYWDGFKVIGTNFGISGIDSYLFERVEVLRGPTSVLYGQNQPGGVVNSVSKRPPAKQQGEVQILGGTFDTKELNVDVGGPIVDGGELSYRVVALLSDEEGQADFNDRRRRLVAPSLSWAPSSATTLTMQLVYQNDDAGGGVLGSLPAAGTLFDSPNGRLPRERFTGDPNYDRWDREILSAGYFLEHAFSDKWSARQNFRYLETTLDSRNVYGTTLQDDNRTVNRSAFGLKESSESFTVDNQLEGHFRTGPLSHNILLGADLLWRNGSTLRRFSSAPTLDLFAPVYFQPIPEPSVFQDNDDEQLWFGLYAQNQIKFERWILTLGGRHDWADDELTDKRNDDTTKTNDKAFTGRVGLGYAFENGITPYIGYAESFEPQSGVDIFGDRFEPTTGEQYEIGLKYDVPDHNAFVTLSAFELTQQNRLTTDPNDNRNSIQTGEIRSRGIELEGVASFKNGWDLTASYTFLDQEITKSNDGDLGKRPAAIPRETASLWASYGFEGGALHGVRIGGGVRYVGRSEGDRLNTFDVPSYTLFDASLDYDLSKLGKRFENWHVAVNASNLTDETYVASCNNVNTCYYGIGRSVIARLKYQW